MGNGLFRIMGSNGFSVVCYSCQYIRMKSFEYHASLDIVPETQDNPATNSYLCEKCGKNVGNSGYSICCDVSVRWSLENPVSRSAKDQKLISSQDTYQEERIEKKSHKNPVKTLLAKLLFSPKQTLLKLALFIANCYIW